MKRFTYALLAQAVLTTTLAASSSYDFAGDDCLPAEAPKCCAPSVQFIGAAEYLFWKAEQTGLDFAVASNILDGASQEELLPANVCDTYLSPKFQYENGFRVGLGFQVTPGGDCCGNSWQFGVIGAHLPTTASECFNPVVVTDLQNVTAPSGGIIALNGLSDFDFVSSHAKWTLNYSSIDVDVGYSCHPFTALTLTPHLGVRTTWMEQKYSINFLNNRVTTLSANIDVNTHLKQDFIGVGLEAGLLANYEFGCGFSALASVSGSLLYVKERVHSNQVFTPLNSTVDVTALSNTHSTTTIRHAVPTLEYFLGLEFATTIFYTTFELYAGWEQQILFDTNPFIHGQGNLSFSGLSAGLGIGF